MQTVNKIYRFLGGGNTKMSKNRYLGRFYYFFRHKNVFFIGQ